MSNSHQRQTKLDSFLGIASKKELKQSTLPFCFKPKLLPDNDEKIEDQLNSKNGNHSLVKNINPSLSKRNQYALEDICDNDDEDEVIGKTSRRKTTMGKRRIINDDDDGEVIVKPTRKKITKGKRRVIDDSDDDDDYAYDHDNMDTTHLAMTPNTTEKSFTSDKCKERKIHDESSLGKNLNKPNDTERKKVDPEGYSNGLQTKGDIDCHEEHPKPVVPQKSDHSDQGKIPSIPSTTEEFTTDSVQIQTEKFVDLSTKDASISLKDSSIKFPDQPLLYLVVCETLEKIEGISSRLEIQSILTNLFRHVRFSSSPNDLYDLVYLCSNSVAPSYDCLELGIGDAILIKAIGEAYGTKPSMVKQKYESEGDLGTVAKASKGKQRTLGFGSKPQPLLTKDVLTTFRAIARTTGSQSQKFKVDHIKKLLVRAQDLEAKYIIRGLQGKLRIGLARSTVLISLAHAFSDMSTIQGSNGLSDDDNEYIPDEVKIYRSLKSSKAERLDAAVSIVKKAYSEAPSYDSLLNALLEVPIDRLHTACTLTPGIPVEPMLAKPTKSIQEVLKRLNGQRFTCEFKYDGERAQVHMLENGSSQVFSRNLLNTSEKYPEIPHYVKLAAKSNVTSFVLDTEVVAFNRETGNLVPFQVLSTRKKTEESAETAKVQVIVQAFDLMYLNGTSLLHKSLSERRDLLKSNFEPVDSKFQFAKFLDHLEDGDTTFLEEFLDAAVKGQCEGLMVKTLDGNAAYEPSKRSLNWLKLKKDYLDGLGDSVDLVPLGAYYGRGKRTGTFGAYLLACYDPENEEYQSVCKLGTGFSDDDLKNLSESLRDHTIADKPSNYLTSDSLACDVWFDAIQVWEVKAADLSKSSTHKGAIGRTGEVGRGIGLRFPRFERVRDDKKPEQATSCEQILEMYYQQDSILFAGAGDDNDDDDGI